MGIREVTAIEWTCAECGTKTYEVDDVRVPGIYVTGEVVPSNTTVAEPFTESYLRSHECACVLLKRKLGIISTEGEDPAIHAGHID